MEAEGLTCDRIRRVALEEMATRRRRLGELTPAQERALESLLLAVSDQVSDLLSAVTSMTSRRGRVEEERAPTTNRLEAVTPPPS